MPLRAKHIEVKRIASGRPLSGLDTSGGGGIRTPGTLAGSAVFKTAPIGHSGTPPTDQLLAGVCRLRDVVHHIFGNVDGDFGGQRQGDRIAGTAVDFDDFAVVLDP